MPDYGYDKKDGLKITGVRDGGPAAKAGLKDGDRIVRCGSKAVGTIYDYMEIMAQLQAGRSARSRRDPRRQGSQARRHSGRLRRPHDLHAFLLVSLARPEPEHPALDQNLESQPALPRSTTPRADRRARPGGHASAFGGCAPASPMAWWSRPRGRRRLAAGSKQTSHAGRRTEKIARNFVTCGSSG